MPRSRAYRPRPNIGVSAATAERDAVILGMRREGMSQAEIARRTGLEQGTVAKAIKRGVNDLMEQSAAESRGLERLRYDWLEKVLVDTIRGRYYVVNNGRVMLDPCDPEDTPLEDPKPRIEAAGVLIRLWERRSKLLGMDMPQQHEVRHITEVDADIERLLGELLAERSQRLANRGKDPAAGPAAGRAEPEPPKALEGPRPPQAAAS